MKAIYHKETDSLWEIKEVFDYRDGEQRELGMKIPCAAGHSFEDGKEYELLKDFAVGTLNGKEIAIPIQPKESEDDLLKEVYLICKNEDWPLTKLKSQFTIKRRS